ncbi:MAG: cell division protein SepF [Fimbriimonadales bacterium]
MDELENGKAGPLRRLMTIFTREEEDEEMTTEPRRYGNQPTTPTRSVAYKSQISVRRQIMTFEDAYAAAQGLKKGEVQIVNLTGTDPGLRQKIVDFLSGVNFSQDGEMVEVGDHIYLMVPADIYVDMTPPTARAAAAWN